MSRLLALVLLAFLCPGAASTPEDHVGVGNRKLLGVAVSPAPVEDATGKQLPVCIIGAGASGLSSALRLRQKGYKDIVIFERDAVPGGRAVTLYVEPNNGIPLYLGAVLGFRSTYRKMIKLLQAYNVPTPSFDRSVYLINSRGLVVPPSALPTNQSALVAAAAKYAVLYDQYKGYLVPGYINGLPPQLQQPFGRWLRDNGLEALLPVLYQLVTADGYGSMEVVPTAYGLAYLSPGNMQAVLGFFNDTFITDFALLWQRVAADLASSGVKLLYKADIMKVEMYDGVQSTGGGSISYKTSDTPDIQRQGCSRIIAAFPPSMENLVAFALDQKQRAVLDKEALVQYISGVINMPKTSPGLFVRLLKDTDNPADPVTLVEPPGDGLPAMISRTPDAPVGQFYTWIAGGRFIPDDTLKQRTVETVSLFNRPASSPVNESVALTSTDLRRLDCWTYFPHFGVSDISADLFKQLEALQGWRNTFWTSSLRRFDIQESVVESAYDIVDRYF